MEEQASAKIPSRLKQSQDNLLAAKQGLQHLEQGVAGPAYVPTMMRELEDLGNSCGVYVTAVRPAPAAVAPVAAPTAAKDKPATPYDTIDLEVRGAGHYTDALKFVKALDSFPKVVEARAISLEPESHADHKHDAGSPSLAMTVQLRAYLFKSDAARPAPTRTAFNAKVKNHAG
jgi:Tfp pilus assembly protein PilO